VEPVPPLPEWVVTIRKHQDKAVQQVVEAFEDNDVVFLDAPTGSGKTLIAEMVRRELLRQLMVKKTVYLCSDKSLQDQFARDFNYAKVLKGRSNYPTVLDPSKTALDCTATTYEDPCWFCPEGKASCPYEIAKKQAMSSPLAVTNTAYFLTEANYVGNMSGRDLIIIDECDTLESMLMNFVEFRAPRKYLDLIRLDPPKKGARKTTIVAWLDDYANELNPVAAREKDLQRQRSILSSIKQAETVKKELLRDIEKRQSDTEDTGTWLRDYDKEETLILKPVTVNAHGTKYLWRHSRKFLCMSATVISAEEMADSLGLPLDYTTVTVPMTFPVSNRPIVMAPVANVVKKDMDAASRKLAKAIQQISLKHEGEKILVHTVSYPLTKALVDYGFGEFKVDRMKFSYRNGAERESVLQRFKASKDGILYAPSMERGVDLPGDLCRVQVIAKVPFGNMGDRQISARMHLRNGDVWYAVQTVRNIVQMAGRGVRSSEDWATTYILDSQFGRNLWGRWKNLFPSWFTEAVDTQQDVRWLL
jgi:ATP-dependent DNA helicase DinG